MEALREYLNARTLTEQQSFAKRCRTSLGYIRKKLSTKGRFGESLAIAFERESGGEVRCEQIRPDVDWAYVRGTTASPSLQTSRKRA